MKLVVEKVSAGYRQKLVLEEVSFTVPAGSITALLGCNGAGKSTLLRCLTGEKRDYQGKILLDGQEILVLDRIRRAQYVACLPQMLPSPHVTVRELVAFGRTPYTPLTGTLTKTDRSVVEKAIETVGLADFAERFVDALSGGEQKKAFFAMALAQDTPVVVLDEPTAHLDAPSRFAFLDLLARMRRELGKTVLMVMHELPEILRYADHVVVLQDRQTVFEGTPEECLKKRIPQHCFQMQITGNKKNGYAVIPIKDIDFYEDLQ